MEVLEVHDDGRIVLEMNEEEHRILIEYAVTNLLKEHIDRIEKLKRKCFDCGEDIDDETLEKFPDTEICLDCINGD